MGETSSIKRRLFARKGRSPSFLSIKIQQKQKFLEQLGEEIEKKKGKVPEAVKQIDKEWDEYEDWDWADDQLYVDNTNNENGDDDGSFPDDDAYNEMGGDDDWVTD